jgi:micrococcal nuclease
MRPLHARFAITGALLFTPLVLLVGAQNTPTPPATPEPPKIPAKDFSKATAYKVLRVIDGDTVVLLLDGKQTSVLLIGVDTPETVHPSKPVEFFGKEASLSCSRL